ncbi:hypothetical protein EVJ22_13410 [Exiguobacterium sp. SH0S7]|uniref:hypothetical protein n=1 Tax=Exiguobacterium sp. SH0S7 TaxID=2510951 RepID=UPI0010397B16|nr:hypothetical protein [Exiguobacterium sp. SH0S7]TCI67850.1 hypothetical protein EVJ22_13410 [Exiguobacterium sp. SH0S7]
MFKKLQMSIVALVLFSGIILPDSTSANSEETYSTTSLPTNNVIVEFNNQEIKEIQNERNQIISEIETKIYSTTQPVEDLILDALIDNSQETLINGIEEKVDATLVKEEKPVSLTTNIENKIVDINDQVRITFEDNYVVVDEFSVSEEIDVQENTDLSFFAFVDNLFFKTAHAATSQKIKNASHSRTIYDVTAENLKLVTAYIGAEFTYDGKTVTARRTGNYMKTEHIAGILINIVEKKSEIQKPSSSRRIAYQEGSAVLGITIKGNGLKLQEKYLRVNVESDAKGNISKSSILR